MKRNIAKILILFQPYRVMNSKTVEVMWIFVNFPFIYFLKSKPFSNMCSGAVNLNNLNFLWFNVEQVRIVLKGKIYFILSICHVIYGSFSVIFRRWCFQYPNAKLLVFYSDCMNSFDIGKTGNKSECLLLSRFENIVCHYIIILSLPHFR